MSIATNNVIAKIAAVVAGLGLVAMSFAYAAPAVKADTTSDLQAQISALMAQIAALQAQAGGSSSASASMTFSKDLTLGSSGADVTALQNWLISKGHTIAAGATGYFGAQTKAALAAYQASAGITPASGYFGPITRAKVNAAGGSTGTTGGTTTGTLSGGEGSIDNISNLGDTDTSLDEGDTGVKVLGAEFDAKDSDIMVSRVDVDIKSHSGNGSSRLTNYVTKVSLMLDGKKLASIDASSVTRDDNGVYSFRFSGLKGLVKEDDTANLYVTLDAVSNLDTTDDNDTWVVNIPQDGIRAVDGAGLSETYVTSSESTTLSETVDFNTASGGTLAISEGTNNPNAGLVVVSATNETKDVTLLEFKLKAKNSDIVIHDFPVGISTSGATASNLIVKRVRLMDGSTVLKTKTLSTTGTYEQITFDNVDYDLNEDVTKTFKVVADIANTDSGEPDNGDSVTASTTGALSGWDAEDAQGDTLTESTDITGSLGGDAQSFYGSNGIAVTYKSASASSVAGSIAGAPDVASFNIKFSVKNLGDDTIYFDGDVTAAAAAAAGGMTWATTSDSTTGTSTSGFTAYGTGILSADVSNSNDVFNSGDKRFEITSGSTRDFTFAVSIPAGGDNVNAGIKLTGFSWDTTSQDATANLYTFDLGAFKTNTLTGLYIQ